MVQRRTRLIIVSMLLGILVSMSGTAMAETGEEIFARICKACHTVGQGKLVGPDLAGASQRRTIEWLVPFIQSSQTVIKSGDADANALFEEYTKLVMPDNPLSRLEVMSVINYIEATAGDPTSVAEVLPTPLETATEQDLARGAALFQGLERLSNGGPACNSCHHVNVAGVMGGGILAKDLTTVLARMPAPGVQAILGSPPFPVMQQAYVTHPLSDDEIFALTAFLEKLNADQAVEAGSSYGLTVFFGGLAGMAVLMTLFSMIWMNRKQKKVYQDIHGRQLNTR